MTSPSRPGAPGPASSAPSTRTNTRGDAIGLPLSPARSAGAAKRIPAKALPGLTAAERPAAMNTNKAATQGTASADPKTQGSSLTPSTVRPSAPTGVVKQTTGPSSSA